MAVELATARIRDFWLIRGLLFGGVVRGMLRLRQGVEPFYVRSLAGDRLDLAAAGCPEPVARMQAQAGIREGVGWQALPRISLRCIRATDGVFRFYQLLSRKG